MKWHVTQSPVILSFVHSFMGQTKTIKAESVSVPAMGFKNAEMSESTLGSEGAEAKRLAVVPGVEETKKVS